MKAVICSGYGPPDVLQIKEVEKPMPKNNEILVRVRATTVTAADHRLRSFTVPAVAWLPARIVLGIRRPRNPILGVELSGEIEAVGSEVKRFKKGDLIFAATLADFGAYAQYKCLPENGPIAIKPANSTFEEAAAIPIGARTALHFLKKGNIMRGQKVLVYGASGSVGTYAVQLARYFGAVVTGVCSAKNAELVKSLGAEKVLDYTKEDFTQKLEMYDMIFLAVDKWPFSVCNKFLAEKGTFIDVTNPVKSLSMLWVSLTTPKRIITSENVPNSAEALNFLKGLVESGELKPVIDRTYPLKQMVEAHSYVDQGHKRGNVAITVD